MSNEIINFNTFYEKIKLILETGRNHSYRAVNFEMIKTYWKMGELIILEEQNGSETAEYGKMIIKKLSKKLTKEYGTGYSTTTLKYIRQFYLTFQNSHALSDQLTWTHYRLLLKVSKDEARQFYFKECIENNWSTRELDRQINSLLFERLTISKNSEEVKEIALEGQKILKPSDIIKDPCVFEFLDIAENKKFLENELESALMEKLQMFLLELVLMVTAFISI